MMRRRDVLRLGALAAAAGMIPRRLFAVPVGTGAAPRVRHSIFVMGQVATITIETADGAFGRHAATAAFEELKRFDRLCSVFDPRSALARVNLACPREPMALSADLRSSIATALGYARRTRGAFDPTVEPLMDLWGFHSPRDSEPTTIEVDRALAAVGADRVIVDGDTIQFSSPGSSIDLGGIAVGMAIDAAVAALRREGVDRALVDVSGDLFAVGSPADSDRGWPVAIIDPLRPSRARAAVWIRDRALSTSGNYENVVTYRGAQFGHIFDPHRGFPAHGCASATVVAPTATAADALSTAVFVDPSIAVPEGAVFALDERDAPQVRGAMDIAFDG